MLVVRHPSTIPVSAKRILLPGGFVCIVDAVNYDFLIQFPWRYVLSNKHGYAGFGKRISGKYYLIRMHRMIVQAPNWMKVHHENHLRLYNLESNLKLVTEREHRHFDGWHIFYR